MSITRISYLGSLAVLVLIAGIPASDGALSIFGNRLADPHIINGVRTDIRNIPYQISVECLNDHICGGSIVSESWIVTAAHCVAPDAGPVREMRIRAGFSTKLPLIGSRSGSTYDIEQAFYHTSFTRDLMDFDVGIIKVVKNFVFNDKIQPIPVPPAHQGEELINYNEPATVSGYGVTKDSDKSASWFLMSGDIPLMSREKCREKLSHYPHPTIPLTDRMICGAGTGPHGVDINKGDSGGPLVQKGRLIGITSWSLRLHDPSITSVFTNVLDKQIRNYIKDKTGV